MSFCQGIGSSPYLSRHNPEETGYSSASNGSLAGSLLGLGRWANWPDHFYYLVVDSGIGHFAAIKSRADTASIKSDDLTP